MFENFRKNITTFSDGQLMDLLGKVQQYRKDCQSREDVRAAIKFSNLVSGELQARAECEPVMVIAAA